MSKAGIPLSDYNRICQGYLASQRLQSDEIFTDCCGQIFLIPQPDCQAKFLGNSEKLPLIDMSDYHQSSIIISPSPPPSDASSSTGPIFHPIFHPTLRSVGQWLVVTAPLSYEAGSTST